MRFYLQKCLALVLALQGEPGLVGVEEGLDCGLPQAPAPLVAPDDPGGGLSGVAVHEGGALAEPVGRLDGHVTGGQGHLLLGRVHLAGHPQQELRDGLEAAPR